MASSRIERNEKGMNPEEYRQVKKIFQATVELLPEKRAEFLDSACQGNNLLRNEVERLLNAEDEDFMEESAMARMAKIVVKDGVEESLASFSHENKNIGESDRYKITSKIGMGGMGEIYLAQDTKLKRQVAIKFLSREFSQDYEILDRFIQEAQSASALNHPNIITVFEIKKQDKLDYIVSEYIEGETLAEQMSGTKLPLLTAIDIAIQIASALTATHKAGIIHRDIKPDNVMIRKDGIVKVLDFGLAKPTFTNVKTQNQADSITLAKVMTTPGMIMGTPQYMSPEQASGRSTDARTDIFSFGVVLYEMITGNPPFQGESPIEIFGSILKDVPPPIKEFVNDIPSKLEDIINKTLRKDPQNRYQKTGELLADLEDLHDELKFEAKLSHTTHAKKNYDSDQTTKNIANSRRFSFIHATIFLIIIATFTAVVWWFAISPSNNGDFSSNTSLITTEITNWSSSPGELFTTGAFSPNSKMIAFGSTKSGTKSIWIKQTDSGEAIQTTKDSFENKYPIWSPNGEEIAFFSVRNGKPGIWSVPILGGSPNLITTLDDESTQLRFWGESGKIYFESNRNLSTLDTDGGKKKQLTDFDVNSSNVKRIAVSPDEKHIAYIIKEKNKWKISVKDLDNPSVQEIIKLETELNSLVWHPDGNRLLFSALTKGIFQIFTLNIEDGTSVQITFSNNDCVVQDVSTDGKQILFSSARENSNLWYVGLENSNETIFRSDIASDLWVDISPDNQTVVFQSIKNLSQGNKLLRGSINAKTAENQTLQLAENSFLPSWSADGNSIAYLRQIDKQVEVWAISNAGGDSKRITTGGIEIIGFTLSPYNRLETKYYDWSPNSSEIVYVSNRNGTSNIWLVSSDGSKDTSLTDYEEDNQSLYCPIWSSNGNRIAYSSRSKTLNADGRKTRKFWIYDKETNEVLKIFETNETVRLIGWSENEKELIYALTQKDSSLPPEVYINSVSIETGEQKLIATLKDTYYYNIHLSPDRKTLAYTSRLDKNDEVWIVNSKGEAPRKLTNNTDPRLYFSSLSWSPDSSTIYFGKQSRFSLLSKINNFE